MPADRPFAPGLERLARSRSRFLDRLAAMPAGLRDRPPRAGAWSALQVLEHLTIAEEFTAAALETPRLPDRMGSAWAATARLRLLFIVFALPVRLKAPSRKLLPSGGMEELPLRERWRVAVERIEGALKALPASRRRDRPFRHPVCGWLRLDQMLAFHDAHVRHHTAQLTRIERALDQAVRVEPT